MVCRCIRMFGALACLLVLLPGSAALAANEAEPNDTLPGADSQSALLDGAIVGGGLATIQDVDAFRVEIGPGVVQLSALFENRSDPAIDPNIEIGIADAQGHEVFTDAPYGGVSTSPPTADLRANLRGPGTFYVYARFFCDGSTCLFAAPGQTTYGLRIKALSGRLLSTRYVAPPVVAPAIVVPPASTQPPGLKVGKARRARDGKRRFSITAVAAAAGQRVVVTTFRGPPGRLRRVSRRRVTLIRRDSRAGRSVSIAAPRRGITIRIQVRIGSFDAGGVRYLAHSARRTAR